jgi:predicted O-methyltransferase YrrM
MTVRLKSRLSQGLGRLLTTAYCRSLDKSRLPSAPLWLWRTFPRRLREWLSYRVIAPAENYGRGLVNRHEVLGRLGLPQEAEYALTSSSFLNLWGLLAEKSPKRIIEFGSGASTLVFAAYAREISKQSPELFPVVSVESHEGWLEQTKEKLERVDLLPYVRFIHAPIQEQLLMGAWRKAYSLPEGCFREDEKFDFCLVDGPPREIGRSGCLPLIEDHLADGATVLLDDVFRPGEQKAWAEWKKQTKGCLLGNQVLLTAHGMARGLWHKKSRNRGVPELFGGLDNGRGAVRQCHHSRSQ